MKLHLDPPATPTSFRILQIFGYLLGGMVPVAVFVILEKLGLHQKITDGSCLDSIIILTLFGFLIGICILLVGPKSSKTVYFKLLFSFQAIFSFLLIHILVLYTGGPKASVFAFSYLYLPAVVGYIYGSGVNLYGASLMLGISCLMNLFFFSEQRSVLDNWMISKVIADEETTVDIGDDTVIFLTIFIIQLIVTNIIATKEKSAKESDYDESQPSKLLNEQQS